MPSEGSAGIVLAALGVTTFLSASVIIVLGQEYLPNRVGFASGITIGLAVSGGGMTTPILGLIADWRGLGTVMAVLEGILIIATIQSFLLPAPSRGVAVT
jgi:FSR family fosmidomycin resistance protein-like MFS transporter